MRILSVLITINIALVYALPKNDADVLGAAASESSSVAGRKEVEIAQQLSDMSPNDYIHGCTIDRCHKMTVAEAMELTDAGLMSVKKMETGDEKYASALAPTMDIMEASLAGIEIQKDMLMTLQMEMDALSNAFSETEKIGMDMKGAFEQNMFATPTMKGLTFAQPPTKGDNAAATMQLEGAMCPMTMYELGTTKRMAAATKMELNNAIAMNGALLTEKQKLETGLIATQAMLEKQRQETADMAKFAAEMKSQAETLAQALEEANAQKAAVDAEKALLEEQLQSVETALAEEQQNVAELTDELQACNDDKDNLIVALDQQTERAINAETELAETRASLNAIIEDLQAQLNDVQSALMEEQNAHSETMQRLHDTERELEASEVARRSLEESLQRTEDDLAETRNQLISMTDERDQLQIALEATQDSLAKAQEENLACNAELQTQIAALEESTEQLNAAVTLLKKEKEAREQIMQTLMIVKAASEKLQEELRKLQMENIALTNQIMKMRSEQEAALSMASGCPPTYVKFGLSCYKYVREKTEWKMAQEQCMKDGGNLVSVESKLEQIFLVDFLRRHEARFDDKYVHLGAFDFHADGVFKWLSIQTPVDAGDTFWLPSNPRGNGRRCLAFQTNDMERFGQWADEYCWVPLPFMCEIETAPFQ